MEAAHLWWAIPHDPALSLCPSTLLQTSPARSAEARALTTLVPEVAHVWETTAGTARQLLERLEALQTYIQTEIGKTMVIARTKRQLLGRVALEHLLQEDLIEDEEACLLPVLRTRLSEARQWEQMV
jgi:hypothetical protein